MRFTKMHGIGNDYVYVDCFAQPLPADPPALARKIADRHFGVGGDGLILICPSDKADARMRMFNADGSEAEMCGNGVRCVAKYVYDHGIARKPSLKIETGRGVLNLDLEIEGGKVQRVRVDMGEPILEATKIPVVRLKGERIIDHPLPHLSFGNAYKTQEFYGSLEGEMTCVSMGNPHVVIYCRKCRTSSTCKSWDRQSKTSPYFPESDQCPFRPSPFAAQKSRCELGSVAAASR